MPRKYENSGPPVLLNLKGKLWRVEEDCWFRTGIMGQPFSLRPVPAPGEATPSIAPHTWHSMDGILYVKKGYIGDGSSVPLIGRWLDGRSSPWGWITHDVAYEAGRSGQRIDRQKWDALYADVMDEFGVYWLTSRFLYAGLRVLGARAASPKRGPEYERRQAKAAA